MKLWKKLTALTAAVALTVSFGVTASARGYGMGGVGAQAAVNVSGQSLEELREQMSTVNCMGTLMAQQGLLEEFQEERLRLCEDRLNQCVANGTITQEQADSTLAQIKERQALCDGSGQGACNGLGLGLGNGACDGTGQGWGNGNGACDGTGQGWGNGNGACDGTGQGQGWGGGHHGGGRGCGRAYR